MDKKYFIASGKDHLGPFSMSELQAKKLNPDTLIWSEDLGRWTKATEITELKDYVIHIPPPTPIQISNEEHKIESKIKFQINAQIFKRTLKKTGIFMLITFVVLFLFYNLVVNIDNDLLKDRFGIYVKKNDNLLFLLALTSLIKSSTISFVYLIMFFFIEKQDSYYGLLKFNNEQESRIFQNLADKQARKYHNTKPNQILLFWGHLILAVCLIFGFFPETYVILSGNDYLFDNFYVLFFFIRIILVIVTILIPLKKNRNIYFWILFIFFFPSFALISLGSLSIVNEKKNISNMDNDY